MPTKKDNKKTKKAVTSRTKTVNKKSPAKPKKKTTKVAKVKAVKKTTAKKTEAKKSVAKGKPYYGAVGRRKRAIARVRLFTVRPFESEDGRIVVNGKPYTEYFSTQSMKQTADSSLRRLKSLNRFEVTVKVSGGGLSAQADAVRHGISRALVEFNPDFRKKLRRAGFLTRDPRKKERKKFGLRKARRAPQWSKR